MVLKCVHKGCGKQFENENEECLFHPGPPEFHEGQKGWKCCKPRVLTFDEFLAIPPCTKGKHSTLDDSPKPAEPLKAAPPPIQQEKPAAVDAAPTRKPLAASASAPPAPPAAPESDSDEPTASTQPGVSCKRRGCGHKSTQATASGDRSDEKCVYHPGQALFHEGSKGWSCCKRRVLEFDEFLKIQGCKERPRHCFVGKKQKGGDLERLDTVRSDFYQTGTTVHASIFLKKIDKAKSTVKISEQELELDLRTQDGKWYQTKAPLFAKIDPVQSAFRILGTKLDLTLIKTDDVGWPVLRSDEKQTGEIIQTGRAGRA